MFYVFPVYVLSKALWSTYAYVYIYILFFSCICFLYVHDLCPLRYLWFFNVFLCMIFLYLFLHRYMFCRVCFPIYVLFEASMAGMLTEAMEVEALYLNSSQFSSVVTPSKTVLGLLSDPENHETQQWTLEQYA